MIYACKANLHTEMEVATKMIDDSNGTQTVFVVDDDQAIRHAMGLLMQSVGLNYEIFETANEFLKKMPEDRPGCLVLDIRMPNRQRAYR